MKNVLSQLHNIINSLEENYLSKEASILNNLFVKLSAVDSMKYYRSPPLSDVSGEPNANTTEFTSGHPKIDEKIHKSPSYQKLKNEWLISRQAYLAAKKTSALSNYTNPNVKEQNEKKEENLRQNWIEAEGILESWYMGAYSQVAAGRPIQEIKKLKMQNIDLEKRNRNRSTVKPVVKPTVKLVSKPVSKPVEETSKPSAPKSVQKPVAPKPVLKPNEQLTEQVKPIQNNLTESQIYFKAQMSYLEYEDKVKELGSKEKAYKDMQDKVYYADKTKGKLIYKEWQKLTGLNAEMSQDKKPEYTYDPIIDSKYSPAGPEFEAFEASNYFKEYKSKIDAFGSKAKAYADMQAKVYNADKTRGKKIYKEWLELVDSDNK